MKLYKFEVTTVNNTKDVVHIESISEKDARQKFRGNERFVEDFKTKKGTNINHIVDYNLLGEEAREVTTSAE